jgi:CheY-like chemotaxis protein
MPRPQVILLVEDDEFDIVSVQRSLNQLPFDCQLLTAHNGIEALMLLRKKIEMPTEPFPSLVLLDLNMPRMNGIEFLRQLRSEADPGLACLPVYIMTTSSEEYDRETTEKLGVSGYLIKPLNFNDNTKRSASMDHFMQFHLLKILENA